MINKQAIKKRIIGLIAAMLTVSIAAPALTPEQTATGNSADNPIEIGDQAGLLALRTAVNNGDNYQGKTVILTADITVTNWSTSIGDAFQTPFSGTFDGQGHVIALTGSDGLFGNLSVVGTIRNLGVKVAITTSGTKSYGGIAERSYGTIERCYTRGSITVDNEDVSYAGGITGQNFGTVRDCYSTVSITVKTAAGGITQINKLSGTIERCFATGAISAGKEGTGGIAGTNEENGRYGGGMIKNCIALNKSIVLNTSIPGDTPSGRIVGINSGTLTGNYAGPLIPDTWDNKGTDNKNGADLTVANFLVEGATGAFTGWDSGWDFTNNDYLPMLMTTGLTRDIAIAGQGDNYGYMPARDGFLEEVVEISTAVTYDKAVHNGKAIHVIEGGTFTIASDAASLKKLTLEEGGQVVAGKAFTVREFAAPIILGNKWIACGYNQTIKLKVPAGDILYGKYGYESAQAKDQLWKDIMSQVEGPMGVTFDKSLLAMNTDVMTKLILTDKKDELFTIPADVAAQTGEALNTGIFLYCVNPTLHNVNIPVAYILNADGTRFERTENAMVKPFQSYLVANAATPANVMSLRSNGIPTANELPANGQTGSTDTKAKPDIPAMPYKLGLITIGDNKGTVTVADSKAGGDGIITVEKDTLVYGATGGSNATTVQLTVTPTTGYIVRKDYPKAYKTGDTGTTVLINGSGSPYTFSMPAHPVTVEIAYARPLKNIGDITLKESKQTAEEVIAILPKYVPITFTDNRKDSLKVSVWSYATADNDGQSGAHDNGNTGNAGAYNGAEGAVNIFTFTLADALPDSIDANGKLKVSGDGIYTGTVKVANMAQPLILKDKDKGITISAGTGDNLNAMIEGEAGSKPFNGTIGRMGSTSTVKFLEISENVTDATLTFNNIAVAGGSIPRDNKTTIKEGANVTIKLEGSNILGNLTVDEGASLILQPETGAKLTGTTTENAGTFIDSTATVTQVTGTGALDIKAGLDGGGSVEQNTSVNLTASTNDKAGITTFTWQKQNDDGSYTDITTNSYNSEGTPIGTRAAGTGITDTYTPSTASVGSTRYRCLIRREVTGSNTAITLLSTKTETVTVIKKSDPTPPTPPSPTVYYTITLPSLTGATTDPAAGDYDLESWDNFGFFLTLDKDYDQSKPIVTTSKGETIAPRASDGKYIIKNIYSDLSVSITGIVKNNPTANEDITAPGVRVWGSRGYLYVSQPTAGKVVLYTFGGALLKSALLPAGDSQLAVPAGSYVVMADGDNCFKVIIQ